MQPRKSLLQLLAGRDRFSLQKVVDRYAYVLSKPALFRLPRPKVSCFPAVVLGKA